MCRSMRLNSIAEEPEQVRLPMLGEGGVGGKVHCVASKWGQSCSRQLTWICRRVLLNAMAYWSARQGRSCTEDSVLCANLRLLGEKVGESLVRVTG